MAFRFYTNMISQASRSVANAILLVGLMLIGFGAIIIALPRIFAFLAAAIFFIAGIGCGVTAIKIFLAQRQIDKLTDDQPYGYKERNEIYTDEYLIDDK
jgi:hypothetical protein